VRRDWFNNAKSDLNKLPFQLTRDLPPADKATQYARIKSAIQSRVAELERLIEVSVTEPRLVGQLRVHGAAAEPAPEEKNSEQIAVKRVWKLLSDKGWDVTDVQTEGRGYDLRARKGQHQRLVEVKGLWGSAASQGIRMTGNEVLIATQHRDDYWLYVVDDCQNGGTLFGVYRDPIGSLGSAMTGEAVIKVPGKALKDQANTTEEHPA
jgi:hypothetical protein